MGKIKDIFSGKKKKVNKKVTRKKIDKAKVEMAQANTLRPTKKISRSGYVLNIVDARNEQELIDLANTGRVIGEIRYDDGGTGIYEDEVVIALRD